MGVAMNQPTGRQGSEGSETGGQLSALIAQLSEKDGKKRQGARQALIEAGEAAVEPLHEILGDRANPARWEAAKALAEIGSKNSSERLVACLEDNDSDIAWLAAKGLIRIGVPALHPLFARVLEQPDSRRLKQGVHHVLHDLRDRRTRELLQPYIKTFDSNVSAEEIAMAAQECIHLLDAGKG